MYQFIEHNGKGCAYSFFQTFSLNSLKLEQLKNKQYIMPNI
jgi:hypothetical protein